MAPYSSLEGSIVAQEILHWAIAMMDLTGLQVKAAQQSLQINVEPLLGQALYGLQQEQAQLHPPTVITELSGFPPQMRQASSNLSPLLSQQTAPCQQQESLSLLLFYILPPIRVRDLLSIQRA